MFSEPLGWVDIIQGSGDLSIHHACHSISGDITRKVQLYLTLIFA
jgi:hypothetical protein